jgi:hypothetical protein
VPGSKIKRLRNGTRGRDQEDCGSKPAQANSLRDPILKKPITKKGLVEWLKVKALSSNPSPKERKREKEMEPEDMAQW